MKKFCIPCVPLLAVAICLIFTSCVNMVDGTSPEITVAADRTRAGENYNPPTSKQPQYYILATVGALELGGVYAGEAPMSPRDEVEPLIIGALKKQNFHHAGDQTPPPALVIIYAWGSINPEELYLDADAPLTQVNEKQMLDIVATSKDDLTPGSFDRTVHIPDLAEGRHFILIGAYDYDTFDFKNPKKKRTILWRAKLSVPNSTATLAQSIPALLETGADFFGQDGPSTTLTGKLRTGTVEIGEAKVVEENVGQNTKNAPKAKQPSTATADTQ